MAQSKATESSRRELRVTIRKSNRGAAPLLGGGVEGAEDFIRMLSSFAVEKQVSKRRAAGDEFDLSSAEERVLKGLRRKSSQLGSESDKRSLLSQALGRIEHDSFERSYSRRLEVLCDVANMEGEGGTTWFLHKWSDELWQELPTELVKLRDQLRFIWRGDANFSQDFLEGKDWILSHHILNEWLRWRPSPEQSEARKADVRKRIVDGNRSGDWGLNERDCMVPDEELDVDLPFRCSLFSGRLVPQGENLHAMLIQGVFEHWGHFKYCANPGCATPFFIAKRKDQMVCDAEICKAEKQREHARKWWNENRAKKSQKPTKVTGKSAKKGSRKNVTRKTR